VRSSPEGKTEADGNVVRLRPQSKEEPPHEEPKEEQPKEEPKPKNGIQVFSSFDFTAHFVPPDYLIDGILQRRFFYSFTGPTGHGKTAVALLLMYLVGTGQFLGERGIDKGHVVILAGENPDDVRMRWIAMSEELGFDPGIDTVHFLPGVFGIAAMRRALEKKAKDLGIEFALVIVDTSAAYFSGNDENSNAQLKNHARDLRTFVELPGGPCVLVSCHPTKNADMENLLPRGGGAFVAEVDGNLICRKQGDDMIEVHWHGKFRGPDFNPVNFELKQVNAKRLVDSKGRQIPTILALPLDEAAHSAKRGKSRDQEDELLVMLSRNGEGLSLAALAQLAGWITPLGEPAKAKAQRVMSRLRDAGLVRNERGDWQLTEAGKKAATKINERKKGQEPQ
jgi:hypothetical protein